MTPTPTPVPTRRRRRWLLVALLDSVVASGMVSGSVLFAVSERGHLPPGTRIDGVQIGERSRQEAGALLLAHAGLRRARTVRVVAAGREITTSGEQLAARPLIDAAIRRAAEVRPIDRVLGHLGFEQARAIRLAYVPDQRLVDDLAGRLDAAVGFPPREATVSIVGGSARVSDGAPGREVDRRMLAMRLRHLPRLLIVPLVEAEPAVSTKDAAATARAADKLLASPRTITLGTKRRTLSPSILRRLIRFQPADAGLVLTLDLPLLKAALRPLRRLETPIRDASFRIVGRRVKILPGRNGRVLDYAAIARSLVRNRGSTLHRARFLVVKPTRTIASLKGLGVRRLIGEFTTEYPCCAPRVTNIQRAAEILDGTIIEAGKTFSLNEQLGKRTSKRGFVAAPQIFAGRLEDAVGGGVSQVATTLYNAAFFAGLRLDAHTPHQFYISRYPMGREATVSWGGPELIFTNDWPAAVLLKVRADDTSITARFYSSKLDRRVETKTCKPHAYVAPTTRIVTNGELAPGQRVSVQSAGPPGFTVEYTRKVYAARA